MECISWTDKITNEEVLRRVGEKRSMLETIVRRKKNWIGHIMRGDGLMKEVIEGKMEGKRVKKKIMKTVIWYVGRKLYRQGVVAVIRSHTPYDRFFYF